MSTNQRKKEIVKKIIGKKIFLQARLFFLQNWPHPTLLFVCVCVLIVFKSQQSHHSISQLSKFFFVGYYIFFIFCTSASFIFVFDFTHYPELKIRTNREASRFAFFLVFVFWKCYHKVWLFFSPSSCLVWVGMTRKPGGNRVYLMLY